MAIYNSKDTRAASGWITLQQSCCKNFGLQWITVVAPEVVVGAEAKAVACAVVDLVPVAPALVGLKMVCSDFVLPTVSAVGLDPVSPLDAATWALMADHAFHISSTTELLLQETHSDIIAVQGQLQIMLHR
ncbi:hypothetical protein CVT25_007897 [Psilocybe cyanescens]|uniref:Uncharacterized protein n=1 Tax=Psilocybe cyanescens TaxID=93625 RepID=A0A409XHS2_PSICY|nr:hypothetical protein CVT25_007897 [Psilocybe cyanescens]